MTVATPEFLGAGMGIGTINITVPTTAKGSLNTTSNQSTQFVRFINDNEASYGPPISASKIYGTLLSAIPKTSFLTLLALGPFGLTTGRSGQQSRELPPFFLHSPYYGLC